jgi:hypothetical protein
VVALVGLQLGGASDGSDRHERTPYGGVSRTPMMAYWTRGLHGALRAGVAVARRDGPARVSLDISLDTLRRLRVLGPEIVQERAPRSLVILEGCTGP